MISIHAGRVHSWATCLVPVDAFDQLLASMRHLGHPIGMAWRWGEVRRGVLALADPMAIDSNIGFVNPTGGCLTEGERVIYLNGLVHALDWQKAAAVAAATARVEARVPERFAA